LIEETDQENVETPIEEISDVESKETDSETEPFGSGSANALEDGSAPSSDYIVKAKISTKIYHPEESSFYGRTKADVWFTSAEAAETAGFRLPNSMQKKSDDSEETKEESEMEQSDDNNDEENE